MNRVPGVRLLRPDARRGEASRPRPGARRARPLPLALGDQGRARERLPRKDQGAPVQRGHQGGEEKSVMTLAKIDGKYS